MYKNCKDLSVILDPPFNGVSCGAHSAPTCAACPQGHGPSWCNGHCTWDYTESECVIIGVYIILK